MLAAGATTGVRDRIVTHALRSHRTVWFVSLLMLKLNSCFLLETGIACNDRERLLLAKWHPKAEPTPKDATKLAVFFRFFRVFPLTFQWKTACKVTFRLSRPVSCKNQENGAGNQWSLQATINSSLQRSSSFSLGIEAQGRSNTITSPDILANAFTSQTPPDWTRSKVELVRGLLCPY